MSGIYFHIPFCRQACHYCNFHFSTNLKLVDRMVDSIVKEMQMRCDFLSSPIETIYFGGGTPSILNPSQVAQILTVLKNELSIQDHVEVTFEVNPEDCTEDYLMAIKDLGINRLSMGFQSFDNQQLEWMNRSHNVSKSIVAYENARKAGFENISIDLIYALPTLSNTLFEEALQKVVYLQPEHVSIYGLTVEPKTVLATFEKKGTFVQMGEIEASKQYLQIVALLSKNGLEQYEVANFCKAGFRSKHNSAYWANKPYLGVGPAAHSYDGLRRFINIDKNLLYISGVQDNQLFIEVEELTPTQKFNERVITRLRTIEGINMRELLVEFSIDLWTRHEKFLSDLEDKNYLTLQNEHICLKPKGFLVADEIALQLFLPT